MRTTVLFLALAITAEAAAEDRHRSPEGWELRAPKAWKLGAQGARVVFGSDTEAGLMVAWYAHGVTLEQMEQLAAQGIQEQGVSLLPTAPPRRVKLKAGPGVAVELGGTGADGVPVRARAVGVAGPRGAVAVLGLTSAEKFDRLKGRVDEVASSVRFFKPEVSAAMRLLSGGWWHYRGSSSGGAGESFASTSTERKVALCPDGRFFDNSETSAYFDTGYKAAERSAATYGSGTQASAYGGGQNARAGRWTAVGNQQTGTITLTLPNGVSRQVGYRMQTDPSACSSIGCDAVFDGLVFHRSNDLLQYCQ